MRHPLIFRIDRAPLRDLCMVHLKRVRGQMPFEEAMTFCQAFRSQAFRSQR